MLPWIPNLDNAKETYLPNTFHHCLFVGAPMNKMFSFKPHDSIWVQKCYLFHKIMVDDWKTLSMVSNCTVRKHKITSSNVVSDIPPETYEELYSLGRGHTVIERKLTWRDRKKDCSA